MPRTAAHFDTLIEKIRGELHGLLKARFWRGLGLGLIVFSPELIKKDEVEKSVYSGSNATTTLIHWIINVSSKSSCANIAHTFTQMSTTPIVNDILDALGIIEMNRNILYTNPVSPLKMKLW